MPAVLVVEDHAIEAQQIEGMLRSAGYDVLIVPNGDEALARMAVELPAAILTDMHMPSMSGLELVQAIRQKHPQIPVILTTDRGTEELAVEALRCGASSYIPKRNLGRDIVPILEEILTVTASQQKRSEFLSRMTSAEYHFTLENNPDLISQVVQQLEMLLTSLEILDENEQLRVGMGVHEAIVNAMVHGNLEVSSQLKEGNWDGYHQLIEQRSQMPPYCSRRVHVTLHGERSGLLWVKVRDEGHGFDPSQLPDPTNPDNLATSSGRGLLLIRTFFDEVGFNPKGTEIVMVKRSPPRAATPQPE